jgi:hypothetical protein
MYFGHSLPLDVIRHKHSLYNQFYVHHSAPYKYAFVRNDLWDRLAELQTVPPPYRVPTQV